MTILFGWNRFRLKSFTFQELNLPELEQFPNATFQVAQSYFHVFYIPVFPMGKRYDLVMAPVVDINGHLIGRLTVDAVLKRDYPVVQGLILVFAGAKVLVNLVIDISYAFLDPRIRY